MSDQAWQADSSEIHEGNTEAPAINAERGLARRHPEVVAGAKGARRAGQDGNMLRDIAIETAERFGQRARSRRIDRVARRRTVDRDDRHGTIDVAANRRSI